jgi:hypothetical protein
MRNILDRFVETFKTHNSIAFILENYAVYEIMWKNMWSQRDHR